MKQLLLFRRWGSNDHHHLPIEREYGLFVVYRIKEKKIDQRVIVK